MLSTLIFISKDIGGVKIKKSKKNTKKKKQYPYKIWFID